MKTKTRMHAEAVEILNKPGKWLVIKQYDQGGMIFTDSNDSKGYSEEEAKDLAVKHILLGKPQPNQ